MKFLSKKLMTPSTSVLITTISTASKNTAADFVIKVSQEKSPPPTHGFCSWKQATVWLQHLQQFSQKVCLQDHKEHVNENLRYFCYKICGKRYNHKQHLVKHVLAVHDNQKFSCTTCGQTFIHNNSVTQHKAVVHNDAWSYFCKVCNKTFKLNDTLYSHIAEVHKNKRPHCCKFCGKTYKQKFHLNKHTSKVHKNKNDKSAFFANKITARNV